MDKNDFYKHIDTLNTDQLKDLCIKLYEILKDLQELLNESEKNKSILNTMLRLSKKI